MSSTIFTIPPNLPLIREACGKVLPCIAAQSYILDALNYKLVILNKWVRNFDAMSYHRGNPNRISSFFYGSGGRTDVLNYIYIPSKFPFVKGGLVARCCLALICNILIFVIYYMPLYSDL